MKISKRNLAAGAAVAAIGLAGVGGIGMASAATTSHSSDGTSIVDKIATKFNLNKDEVQAVFDEDRTAHHAEMKQDRTERLAQAVKEGKLTQEQSDHITAALNEVETLMGSVSPEDRNDDAHKQIKSKLEALHDWAEQNDIDRKYVMGVHVKHGGGPGGPRFEVRLDDNGDQLSSSSDDNQ